MFCFKSGLVQLLHPFDFCFCLLREGIDKNTIANSATLDIVISISSVIDITIYLVL